MDSYEEHDSAKKSQIFALTWVKQNAAKKNPEQIKFSTDELNALLNPQILSEELNSDEDNYDCTKKANVHITKKEIGNENDSSDDDLKEFNLQDYDNEDNGYMNQISNLCMFASNAEDPYITKYGKKEDGSDSSEDEEIQLLDSDNLLVCACCEKDEATLEIYVYNDTTNDFYIHHDIPLPSTPLCLQWLDFNVNATEPEQHVAGNFIAVGNLDSEISVWDIDVLNTIDPVFTLGVPKRKQKMKILMGDENFGHTDAVLGLSWTPSLRSKLASASVDRLVAVWDLETATVECKLAKHKEKVQSVEWRPASYNCLLSGAFDGRIYAFDTRAPSSDHIKWRIRGEVEKVTWNKEEDSYFAASTDTGTVHYFDLRRPGKALFSFKAHDLAVPGLCMTSSSLLHTASSDGLVKTWKMSTDNAKVTEEKNLNVGMVHCLDANPDVPDVLAVGGERNGIRLWKQRNDRTEIISTDDVKDTGKNVTSSNFSAKLKANEPPAKRKIKRGTKKKKRFRDFQNSGQSSDKSEVKSSSAKKSKKSKLNTSNASSGMSLQESKRQRKKVFKKSKKSNVFNKL